MHKIVYSQIYQPEDNVKHLLERGRGLKKIKQNLCVLFKSIIGHKRCNVNILIEHHSLAEAVARIQDWKHLCLAERIYTFGNARDSIAVLYSYIVKLTEIYTESRSSVFVMERTQWVVPISPRSVPSCGLAVSCRFWCANVFLFRTCTVWCWVCGWRIYSI